MSTQKRDEEDGLFDDATDDSSVVEEPAKKRTKSTRDDESSSEEEEEAAKKPAKKRRKIKEGKFIDDAAEESGSENDSDEEEEDEGEDDYVKDDFVVDEEEPVQREKKGDLEDSDDEEEGHEDDEDEDEGSDDARERRRLKKVRKMKATDRLDEEDLALIQEAQGGDELPPAPEEEEKPRETVVAKSEAELRKGLFYDSGDEDEQQKEIAQKKARRVERYDEDGLDDFIEDDIGDQDDIRRSGRDSGVYDDNDEGRREVSEAQLQEASEIFGTDYLEFMQEEEEPDEEEEELLGKERFRERGVGVQYGMDSDEEILSDESEEDDDLFRDEDEDEVMDGSTAQQKAEALRLKREKRNLAKKERRQQALKKKEAQKKARLRRNFEPALLAENFCTDRDDEIRQTDKPERFFDWKTPFRGSDQKDSLSDEDVAEAKWIANRIPAIASELAAAGDSEEAQKEILCSIANALRFMHKEKLEPEFIKRYRKDYVPSEAVREHLYSVKDEDGEYDRLLTAQSKVATLLETITSAANADENVGADAQKLTELQNELQEAQEKLDDTAKQESLVKGELEALGGAENDDDDELFGDDDEEEVRPGLSIGNRNP
jgi:transcription elongation factor SPT6